jgi:hypothetical protein
MKNAIEKKRPQSITTGRPQSDFISQVLGILLSGNLSADDLPKLPTTKSGSGWWVVAGAGALAVGGVVLGAAALALAGVLLSETSGND